MNKKYFLKLLAIVTVAMLSVGFTACSSDDGDDGIDTSPITLFADKTKTIAGNVSYMISANEFVATVENNVIKGSHVGETTITVNGKHKIPVSVIPFYNIMDDPITEWGASKATVKAKQKQGTLFRETTDAIGYQNCGDASIVAYSFENGKLKSVVVMMPTSKTSSYTGYLKERFAFYPGQFSNYTFLGIDAYSLSSAKTVVALSVYDSSNLSCVYMPAEKFNSNSSAKILELFEFD